MWDFLLFSAMIVVTDCVCVRKEGGLLGLVSLVVYIQENWEMKDTPSPCPHNECMFSIFFFFFFIPLELWGVTILRYLHMWLFSNSIDRHIPASATVHAGCVFVGGIHPSRTRASESV